MWFDVESGWTHRGANNKVIIKFPLKFIGEGQYLFAKWFTYLLNDWINFFKTFFIF